LYLPLSLISYFFVTGSIHQIWRTAIAVPVFKKGVLTNVDNNYRPISLTCCCCKADESVIKDHSMLPFLLKHEMISKHQHGFLTRKSTGSKIIECTNDWTPALMFAILLIVFISISLRLSIHMFMINYVVNFLTSVLVVDCFAE